MKIFEAKIIRKSKNNKTLYKIKDLESETCHFASSVFNTWDLSDISNLLVIILQLDGKFYLLGGGRISGEFYSEYRAGDFVLKYYNNGNITVFPSVNGVLGLSILNFTYNTMRLLFHSDISIPVQNLPSNYYVVDRGKYTTIEKLLPTTEFAALNKIPRNTIIRWKHKKLKPLRITSTGYSYYSIDQSSQAKALAGKRSNSREIYIRIIEAIKGMESGIILYITYFKYLISGYKKSQYSTLRDILRKLVLEGKLEHFKRGYYRIPKKIKTYRRRK